MLTARDSAEAVGAKVYHVHTQRGDREINIIIEGSNGLVVAIEVKLSATVRDGDVDHLNWLEAQHHRPVRKVLVHAGQEHYRRTDGVYVVPLAGLT